MRKLFFFMALIALIHTNMWSQGIKVPKLSITPADTVVNDSLIISEIYVVDWWQWGYIELTNMSSKTIDLNNYFLVNRAITTTGPFEGSADKANLFGTLAPGQSFLHGYFRIAASLDAYQRAVYQNHDNSMNPYVYPLCDTLSDNGNNKYKMWSLWARKFNPVTNIIDSVKIENFNGNANLLPYNEPIAGISKSESTIRTENVSQAKLWIRKINVKRGNAYRTPAITNEQAWTNSRGTDEVDSEWLPIPKTSFSYENYADIPFTTVKQHGVGSLNTIVPKDGITINLNTKKITIPYGIRRDSVFRSFTFGPNLAWMYKNNPDTSKYFCQTGDSIFFYTLGTDLGLTKFVVEATPATNSSNILGSRLYIPSWLKDKYIKDYEITQGAQPMDSISFVPYACRIDSFIMNLTFPEGSSYKMTYVDGIERPDLKSGDKITVTSQSGAEKTYKISCVPYKKNSDATLKTVIFPGMELWTSTLTYLPTDTMYNFGSSSFYYQITVDKDLNVCPEILPIRTNNRAKMTIKRAKNLNGSVEDRTLSVKLVAEDDTTINTYNFVFAKELPRTNLNYTPFFSDFARNTGNATAADGPNQIFNPLDETLDLSEYMIVMLPNGNPISTFINTTLVTDTNKWTLRPGYKVVKGADGLPIFKEDLFQNSIMVPSKKVWAFSRSRAYPNEGPGIKVGRDKTNPLIAALDFTIWKESDITSGWVNDIYGTKNGLMYAWSLWGTNSLSTRTICLFKITNDSVREGLKPMNNLLTDYELIDVVGGGISNPAKIWTLYDKTADGKSTIKTAAKEADINSIYRKPTVYKGNAIDGLSFGIGNDSITILPSEWVDYSYRGPDNQRHSDKTWETVFQGRYKNHTMILTANISYITSPVYKISTDIVGEQSIEGVLSNTAVSDFMNNIVIADTAMRVKVKSNAGTPKTGSDIMVTGDYVTSISATGTDSVVYKVTTGVFDNNNALTSADYTVTIAGDKKTGKISGIAFGTLAKDLVAKLVKPAKATMFLTDGGEGIVSMYTIPMDSNKFILGERNDLIADGSLFVTVKAENGDECNYALEFNKSTTPYILSDRYEVVESEKYINYVNYVITPVFLSFIKPAPGFAVKVVNKMGQERMDGDVRFDDMVVVYDPANMANSTTYKIKFKDDLVYAVKGNKATIGVDAYPNPTTGKFVVKAKKMTQIDVTDITGRNVYSVKTTANEATINLSKENAGIYLVTVRNNDTMETMKIIKK